MRILLADLTDNLEQDDSSSEFFRAEELSLQNARQARGSQGDSGLKDRIYSTVDVVGKVVGGAAYVFQAVPVVVEDVVKLPETMSNLKKETEKKLLELQDGVESTKERIDGLHYCRYINKYVLKQTYLFPPFISAVLAWRPIDEAKLYVKNTQKKIDDSISAVKQTANNIAGVAKRIADLVISLTKPETYDLKTRFFGKIL